MILQSLTSVSHTIAQSLIDHGNILLFGFLAIGIVGMPIPDETLLVTAGYLVAKGKLGILTTLLTAYTGSACGISLSYGIGCTAGNYLVTHYGHWIGITDKRVATTRQWFYHLGHWLLVFGYFIPGVRHLTGYIAGTVRMRFTHFMLFAYSGAILWSSAFLGIGYWLGHHQTSLHLGH